MFSPGGEGGGQPVFALFAAASFRPRLRSLLRFLPWFPCREDRAAVSPCSGSGAAASAGPCVRSTSMVRPPSPCGPRAVRSQSDLGGTFPVCGEVCEVIVVVPFLESPAAVLLGMA